MAARVGSRGVTLSSRRLTKQARRRDSSPPPAAATAAAAARARRISNLVADRSLRARADPI
jgi:hypothetical protein